MLLMLIWFKYVRRLHLAYWLKHWTTDRKVQSKSSSPTCSRDLFLRDLFLFHVHSALPLKLSRRFTFVSFGGDIKPSVPGNPLKISLSAIGSFLVSWVISSKPIYQKIYIYVPYYKSEILQLIMSLIGCIPCQKAVYDIPKQFTTCAPTQFFTYTYVRHQIVQVIVICTLCYNQGYPCVFTHYNPNPNPNPNPWARLPHSSLL